MTPRPTSRAPRWRHVALVSCLSLGLMPGPADAATQAPVTLTASGAAGKELRRAGVQVRAVGGLKTTTLVDGSTRVSFRPGARTAHAGVTTLPLTGALRFSKGARTVRFTGLRL